MGNAENYKGIYIEDKDLCCGCSACSQRCPKQCISMVNDEEGFVYPVVDEKLCINCGVCMEVCPIKQSGSNNGSCKTVAGYPRAYGGWHKDVQIRYDSSSGGVFTLFAEWIIKQQGAVYGCLLDQNMKAVHVGVETIEDLKKLRGSKYVQSEVGNVFLEIEGRLKNRQYVLFVGMPCQVAGLQAFLGMQKYDKLFAVDFICHGVSSPRVFEAYIEYLGKKKNSKVTEFRFRNKDHGWCASGWQLGTEISYANGKKKRLYPAFRDSFMNGFLANVYLRPACYNCYFKKLPKYYSDITIADFWGVAKVKPHLNDKKGTSLILIHGEHGDTLWNHVIENVEY